MGGKHVLKRKDIKWEKEEGKAEILSRKWRCNAQESKICSIVDFGKTEMFNNENSNDDDGDNRKERSPPQYEILRQRTRQIDRQIDREIERQID